MKDSLLVGVIIGMVAGAVLVTSNKKAKNIVEKSKQAVKEQIDKKKSTSKPKNNA